VADLGMSCLVSFTLVCPYFSFFASLNAFSFAAVLILILPIWGFWWFYNGVGGVL
jgi:hypothetical protein